MAASCVGFDDSIMYFCAVSSEDSARIASPPGCKTPEFLLFGIPSALPVGETQFSARRQGRGQGPGAHRGLCHHHPALLSNKSPMDITAFVVSQRDSILLLGDYNACRQQLSRRLLTLRKRLGRATPKNAKYSAKDPVTASDIGSNHE